MGYITQIGRSPLQTNGVTTMNFTEDSSKVHCGDSIVMSYFLNSWRDIYLVVVTPLYILYFSLFIVGERSTSLW